MDVTSYEQLGIKLYIAKKDQVIVAISFSPFSQDYLKKLESKPYINISAQQGLSLEEQLNTYFAGKKIAFDAELELHGSNFQLKVWKACAEIPYGATQSYRDIAVAINNPKAVRAVGTALGANPIPIIIPCHRVIGTNGQLTGFAGGLDIKRKLLDLEKGI